MTRVLDDAEFTTLEVFPLRARFVAWRTGAVPADLARRLKPLSAARASSLAPDAQERLHASGSLAAFRADDAPVTVSDQLRALPIERATPIIVWWNSECAVVTEWGLFLERWGDFCYPAAGDVCIWPQDDRWTLCYRRYEVFQFRGAT